MMLYEYSLYSAVSVSVPSMDLLNSSRSDKKLLLYIVLVLVRTGLFAYIFYASTRTSHSIIN